MAKASTRDIVVDNGRARLKKSERRRQILLELKLRPHVRISELSERFNVSTETVRRDFDDLADDGLISRAHGGPRPRGNGTTQVWTNGPVPGSMNANVSGAAPPALSATARP